VIDEASMLTESQLAALFDACANVERFVLVGDPRQLPPIGVGRPFVDIVSELAPEGVEAIFPRCGAGYAELTIPRRQTATAGADTLLAPHYGGNPLDPGADEVWDRIRAGGDQRLVLVEWNDPKDLQEKLVAELVTALHLAGSDDEVGFEVSLGGARFKDLDRAFFSNRYGDNPGAASKVDAWQMLSPVRGGLEGVDALNRAVQERFRRRWQELASAEGWGRKVPKPIGAQSILYGDKVINVINQKRRDVWPELKGEAYIANGDLGVVIGQYKGPTAKFRGLPWKLEVEFAGQLGYKYGFSKAELGDEAKNPLELAYALTVHKTQGSEFGLTLLVLPNPCWLLSRELLYTALTRHRERLVVLHQGPIADFRRFASEEHSEIARR
jgi:ATP-dependent exoDNAse (exonuclease V) alpha subunit